MMKRFLLILSFFVFIQHVYAQDKRSYNWIFGFPPITYTFKGDTSLPTSTRLQSPDSVIFCNNINLLKPSCISDSATGRLILFTNGEKLYDSNANLIDNGDSLVPDKWFSVNGCMQAAISEQSNIILPKGSNGQYYVFTTGVNDTMYDDIWVLGNSPLRASDILCAVVDMKANGGAGKVLYKKRSVLRTNNLSETNMYACKHANGYDWWLVKKASDSIAFYVLRVTADSVYPAQRYTLPDSYNSIVKYFPRDNLGQINFSNSGNKMVVALPYSTQLTPFCDSPKLLIFDFNRYTGELIIDRVVNAPRKPVYIPPFQDTLSCPGSGNADVILKGACYSPNDSIIYLNASCNIYQYYPYEPNINQRWLHLDSILNGNFSQYFSEWSNSFNAPDGRIYIGNWGGGSYTVCRIDSPNVKGLGCMFKDTGLVSPYPLWNYPSTQISTLMGIPNNPKFDMEALTPDAVSVIFKNNILKVFPNPASTRLTIAYKISSDAVFGIYDLLGRKVLSTTLRSQTQLAELDIRGLPKGVYIYKSHVNGKLYTDKITIE